MKKHNLNEIEPEEKIVVLRDHFGAKCPECRRKLNDTTSLELAAGWYHFVTKFTCKNDAYFLLTQLEEHSAIESDIGQDANDILMSDLGIVRLRVYTMVLTDLISNGIEAYGFDRIEQRRNKRNEYILNRSLCDAKLEGLSIYFTKLAMEYGTTCEIHKQAMSMNLALQHLEDTDFTNQSNILNIAGSKVKAQKIVDKLIEFSRSTGKHSEARRIELELLGLNE